MKASNRRSFIFGSLCELDLLHRYDLRPLVSPVHFPSLIKSPIAACFLFLFVVYIASFQFSLTSLVQKSL